ncbi:ABC transporter ATP-binding protein [Sphingomicrobium lutaoense]|nr:ABC transporter ATP-binding protein [Sphingomicrobium lutaoense]
MAGRLSPSDFAAGEGELIGLVGPNGSGKTSFLRGLAGITGEADRLCIDGEPLCSLPPAARAHRIAYLPASRLLEWPIPVSRVLRLSPSPVEEDSVERMVAHLELEPLLDRPSNALSTGERGRVLLGRALALEPSVLLLDEPLANLDPYWVLKVTDLLEDAAAGGTTIIAALHDLALVGRFGRLLLMREGQIIADGKSEKVANEPLFAATFRLHGAAPSWTL